MFIEIKGNSGIYIKDGGMNSELLEDTFYINLDLVLDISFITTTDTYFGERSKIDKKAIYLKTISVDTDYILSFDKEGMGEYNKIKRIFEELIVK
jgi:hypothetical protein